jgi:predicted alpha/beta-fold hydrolase
MGKMKDVWMDETEQYGCVTVTDREFEALIDQVMEGKLVEMYHPKDVEKLELQVQHLFNVTLATRFEDNDESIKVWQNPTEDWLVEMFEYSMNFTMEREKVSFDGNKVMFDQWSMRWNWSKELTDGTGAPQLLVVTYDSEGFLDEEYYTQMVVTGNATKWEEN